MILMLSVRLAATVHAYLNAYAPTNILIRTLRAPGAQHFAFPASAVMAVGYGLLGGWLTSIIDSGGPGWLNSLVLLCGCYAALGVMPMWVIANPDRVPGTSTASASSRKRAVRRVSTPTTLEDEEPLVRRTDGRRRPRRPARQADLPGGPERSHSTSARCGQSEG